MSPRARRGPRARQRRGQGGTPRDDAQNLTRKGRARGSECGESLRLVPRRGGGSHSRPDGDVGARAHRAVAGMSPREESV